ERGLILAYGENDSLRPVLVAADLATGAVRWEHVQPFHEAPEAVGQDYVGLQAALWVSDTTFILYVSKDGPVLVHAGTGEWLWRGDSLQGKKPPAPGRPPRSLLVCGAAKGRWCWRTASCMSRSRTGSRRFGHGTARRSGPRQPGSRPPSRSSRSRPRGSSCGANPDPGTGRRST